MNILDFIILLCFIPAVISGLKKGFIAQVVAIIALILGAWLSYRFSSAVSTWIGQWIEGSQQLLQIIAFIIIFIVVVFALHLLGKAIEASIKIIMLGWLNKLLGVAFSMLKCMLIIGLLIMAFNAINETFSLVQESKLAESLLYTPIKNMTYSVFPYIKDMLFQ
jgi:colicin V production protein